MIAGEPEVDKGRPMTFAAFQRLMVYGDTFEYQACLATLTEISQHLRR
jgi:hypothetical protein